MMGALQPPDAFKFEGKIVSNWLTWRQSFEYFLTATEAKEKPEKVKTSMLLTCIGKEGRRIYKSFEFDDGENEKLNLVLEKFTLYCEMRTSVVVSRYNFYTHRQGEKQLFIDFVKELKELCEDCNFSNSDEVLRDMIVCGVFENTLRHKLFSEANLDLVKAMDIGLEYDRVKTDGKKKNKKGKKKTIKKESYQVVTQSEKDQSKSSVSEDQQSTQSESDSEDKKSDSKSENPESNTTNSEQEKNIESTTDDVQDNTVGLITDCKCCGGVHPVRHCPAYGRICNTCKQSNHVTRYCPMRRNDLIGNISDSSTSKTPLTHLSKSEVFYIGNNRIRNEKFISSCQDHVTVSEPKEYRKFNESVCLETNGTPIKYTIDAHSQVNILPRYLYDRLESPHPFPSSSLTVSAYDKNELPVDGKCILPVVCKGRVHHILFIVVKSKTTPIFSLDTYERLDLMRRSTKNKRRRASSFVKQYIDVFNDIMRINHSYSIKLKDGVTPKVVRTRHVPVSLEKKLKEKLKIMEGLGIVEKLKNPKGGWINELVCIEKPNGEISVTLDPRALNKVTKRKRRPSQTIAEAIKKSSNAQYFTRLVGASVAWQIELDDKSADLLTFSTQFGVFRFKKLPLGFHTADNIFEAEVTKMIKCMDEVVNIQNDIIIWGDTKDSHDMNLTIVLTCLRKSGFKLEYEKCIFGQQRLSFHGHIMSLDGVKPDMDKIKAITEIPVPVNRFELDRFVDLVNYTGKLIPNLPKELEPITSLLNGTDAFEMKQLHVDAVSKLKTLITSSIVFLIFDPNLPTLIQTCSSSEGLGAMLEQYSENQWFPIAFSSRGLQNEELEYTQDEREYISLLFGCESFHDYVYGRRIFLQNNYEGMNRIYSGSVGDYTKNLQHIYLKLSRYNFSLIEASGEKLVVPEALCRAYLKNTDVQDA